MFKFDDIYIQHINWLLYVWRSYNAAFHCDCWLLYANMSPNCRISDSQATVNAHGPLGFFVPRHPHPMF